MHKKLLPGVSSMNLWDLKNWEVIVMWGAGKDAEWYEGQFHLDYMVDSDKSKIGNKIAGIEVKDISELLKISNDKKVLLIISSSRYENEIKTEIENLGINADITELSVMKAIYDHKNVSFALWGFDILIRDLLLRGGYDVEKMSYIEIGACHPVLGSTTYNSYLSGARKGYLIEPNPDLQETIKRYRNDKCIMEGISEKTGEINLL